MCNACGFACCAYDGFNNCGCDDCHEPACWTKCQDCGEPEQFCDCEPNDDYYEEDPAPSDSGQSIHRDEKP